MSAQTPTRDGTVLLSSADGRESDRIALHAALGFDQELIKKMGA
jgi:hypothetical protein